MAEPRYQRRKEDRPQEISEAAFEVFTEKGYAATRVDEVAKRAGVSKGLLYLYFKTKEELFKAVIRSVVTRRVDALLRARISVPVTAGLAEFPRNGLTIPDLVAQARLQCRRDPLTINRETNHDAAAISTA